MKTILLSFITLLSVLFTQAQDATGISNVTTTTNYQVSGATVQVSLSTIEQIIPGKLHYTFQVYFGDGAYATADEGYYSGDTSFVTTHTYLQSGTYTIRYILGYANVQDDGPVGVELSQVLRTVSVTVAASTTSGLMPVSTGNQQPVIYNSNRQLTIQSDIDLSSVELYNTIGQQVLTLDAGKQGKSNYNLPYTLAPGVYIVMVTDAGKGTSSKEIVLN